VANIFSEAEAIAAVDKALSALEDERARERVLTWANAKYGASQLAPASGRVAVPSPTDVASTAAEHHDWPLALPAQLWLKRNGIALDGRLAQVFSLNQSEVDLIADEIPGTSARARTRNVVLLRGACANLVSGEFRFDDESLRTTCRHYNAYDQANFSKHLRSMSDEVTGTRDAGYTLTAKGQRAAAELIKYMIGAVSTGT